MKSWLRRNIFCFVRKGFRIYEHEVEWLERRHWVRCIHCHLEWDELLRGYMDLY